MNSSLDSLVNNLSEINNKTCVKVKKEKTLHNIVNLLDHIIIDFTMNV